MPGGRATADEELCLVMSGLGDGTGSNAALLVAAGAASDGRAFFGDLSMLVTGCGQTIVL